MDGGNNPDADGDFSNAPIFNFNDGKLKFDANKVDNANDNYGSASAFFPKSLLTTHGVLKDAMCHYELVDRIHPPSILPISSIISWSFTYFFVSIDRVSLRRRVKKRTMLSFTLARSSVAAF